MLEFAVIMLLLVFVLAAVITFLIGFIRGMSRIHHAEMEEAWKLVNAMEGQEPWDRAAEWLRKNEEYKPKGTVQ